jgi:hypothetical protein
MKRDLRNSHEKSAFFSFAMRVLGRTTIACKRCRMCAHVSLHVYVHILHTSYMYTLYVCVHVHAYQHMHEYVRFFSALFGAHGPKTARICALLICMPRISRPCRWPLRNYALCLMVWSISAGPFKKNSL